MTTPTAHPGPGGYGIIPPSPPQPAAASPEPLEGTVAIRRRAEDAVAAAGGVRRVKPEPIDGALLWLLIRRYLTYYVAFRKPSDADLVTAWVFHACARNRGDAGMGPLIWRATPRLLLISRKRGAGKSTLLDLIVFLTGSRRGKVPRITPARLAQITGQAYETVCVDEGSLIFGAGRKQLDLQACILAGYTPNASYEVSKTSLSLFGSVVIATKESLLTDATKAVDGDESSLGDLLDRSLKAILEAPTMPMPEVGEQAEADGALLCRALSAWTDSRQADLRHAARVIADEDLEASRERARNGEEQQGLRAAQIARPLRAVARVIGPGAEQDVAAALEGADEAAEIMAELQERPWASDDGDSYEDDPGRIVYAEDEGWIASTSDPGDYEDEPEPPAPAPVEGFIIRQVIKEGPGEPVPEELTGTYPDMETAQGVCEALQHIAGAQIGVGAWEPLTWQYRRLLADPEARMAIAATRPVGQEWPEITYAVTAAGK